MQRPVTELTLDCDTLVNELEHDSENRGTIYLSGVRETFKEHLLQRSSLFLGLEAVILPKDLKSGKQKKYCFLSKSLPLNKILGKETGDGDEVRERKCSPKKPSRLSSPDIVFLPWLWLGSSLDGDQFFFFFFLALNNRRGCCFQDSKLLAGPREPSTSSQARTGS